MHNVLTNFYLELGKGREKFRDVLLAKYQNILRCEESFREMELQTKEVKDRIAGME
jgi:hypothetical protein